MVCRSSSSCLINDFIISIVVVSNYYGFCYFQGSLIKQEQEELHGKIIISHKNQYGI